MRILGIPTAVVTLIAPVISHAYSQASPFRTFFDAYPEYVSGPIILIDAHPYRHCHYIHTRVYCHKRDRLPMNWPPNTDTPHGKTYEYPSGLPSSRRKPHAL